MTAARLLSVTLAAALALAASASPAADRAAGRAKAKMCIACHAINGASLRPDAPHLWGQVELYLAEQLRAYRSGERKSEVMKIIAAPLSDEDIDNLAAWFAGIPVAVEPVE